MLQIHLKNQKNKDGLLSDCPEFTLMNYFSISAFKCIIYLKAGKRIY